MVRIYPNMCDNLYIRWIFPIIFIIQYIYFFIHINYFNVITIVFFIFLIVFFIFNIVIISNIYIFYIYYL